MSYFKQTKKNSLRGDFCARELTLCAGAHLIEVLNTWDPCDSECDAINAFQGTQSWPWVTE